MKRLSLVFGLGLLLLVAALTWAQTPTAPAGQPQGSAGSTASSGQQQPQQPDTQSPTSTTRTGKNDASANPGSASSSSSSTSTTAAPAASPNAQPNGQAGGAVRERRGGVPWLWIAIGVAVVIALIALFAGRGRDTSHTTIVDRSERLDPMDARNDPYINRRDDDQIRRAG
jgi:hypothetical protein